MGMKAIDAGVSPLQEVERNVQRRAKEIAAMPRVLSAIGACSRLEPHPKFAPATMRSPGCTFFAHVGSTASNACSAKIFGSVVPRYLPAMMWSVEMSSPNVHTRPWKRVCMVRPSAGP